MVKLIVAVLILSISVCCKQIPKDLQVVLDKLYEDGYGLEYTPNGTANAVLTEHLGKADFVSDILGYVSKILSNTVAAGDSQDANIILTNAIAQKLNAPTNPDTQIKYSALGKLLPQQTFLLGNSASRLRPSDVQNRHAELTQSVVNKSIIKQVIDQGDSMSVQNFTASPLGGVYSQNSLSNANGINGKGLNSRENSLGTNGANGISGNQNSINRKLLDSRYKSEGQASPLSTKTKEDPSINKAALFDLFSKFMLEDNPLSSPDLHLMISNITKMIQSTPSPYSAIRENTAPQQILTFGKPVFKLNPDVNFRKDNDKYSSQAADFRHRTIENLLANAKSKGYDFSSLQSPKGTSNDHFFQLRPNELPYDSIRATGSEEYRPNERPPEVGKKIEYPVQDSGRQQEVPFNWWRPQFSSKDSDGLAIFQKAVRNAHWNQGAGEKDHLTKLYHKLVQDENKHTGDEHHGPVT